MRNGLFTIAALVCASTLTITAQQTAPPQQPPRTGDTTQRAQAASDQTVTITGCLKNEKDVPGLTPNPAERVGVTNDFIVTAVKMAPSSKVSGLALASMYEVEGIKEDELQKHLNHQVELTGRIASAATPDDRTPNFQATSLKMVAATCPAP
jgi:hypothetical protein